MMTRGLPAYLVIAAIAAAVAWQLLTPRPIGLADNGDFPRIMGRFDIGYLSDKYEDRYFGYFLTSTGSTREITGTANSSRRKLYWWRWRCRSVN